MHSIKIVNVVCAIISLNDKILVVQRSKGMNLPLKWEFPGGKIEAGESESECIKREIKEELNIEIELVSRLTPTKFEYPTISINLIPFTARYLMGEIKLLEHKQYLWLEKQNLKDLDWAEADIPIVDEFILI